MDKQLESLAIERFRRLRDVTLSDLGRVNLLVGPNNSGKTSVLEAVSTFCRPLDPMEWLNTAWRREVKSSRLPRLDALKWLFPHAVGHIEEAHYSESTCVAGVGTFPVREAYACLTEVRGFDDAASPNSSDTHVPGEEMEEDEEETSESYDGTRRGAELTLTIIQSEDRELRSGRDSKDQVSETFQLWEDERFVQRQEVMAPMLPVATISPVSHRVEQIHVQLLTKCRFSESKGELIKLLNRIDGGIRDLEILGPRGMRPTLYVQHERGGLSPLSAFGDGVRRTLMMALNLLSVRSGVLLIDEIETAIHPSILGKVFRWLVEGCVQHDVQLFATTHSLEAVDAILETRSVDLNDVVGYHLDLESVAAPVRRFGGEMLHRIRHERGLDPR